MYVCVCLNATNTQTHATQLKLKVEQCIKCGSALGFWSVHMAIIKCPPHSLSFTYSPTLSPSLLHVRVCQLCVI